MFKKYKRKIISISIIISVVMSYKLYIWAKTQTTDNAYVEAEISFVAPKIAGNIVHVYFREGEPVSAGDVVLKIDDRDYLLKRDEAKMILIAEQKSLEILEKKIDIEQLHITKLQEKTRSLEIMAGNATRDFDRTKSLVEGGFSTKKNLGDSESNSVKINTELRQAKIDMVVSGQNLELLKLQKEVSIANVGRLNVILMMAENAINDTNVRAPADGAIAGKSLDVGNFARVGVPLFAVVSKKNVHIRANFKETQVHRMKSGMSVIVTIDGIPGIEFNGKIRNVYPAAGSKFSLIPSDNATGNFTKVVQRIPVIIDISIPDNIHGKILPGMSAVARVYE